MLARVTTFAIDGLEPRRVTVEVDIRQGLPAFRVIGLGDTAVRESRERVRSALQNSGFEFPARRITANLAPAYLRKVGPGFDLGLAVGVLAASGQVPPEPLTEWALFGELSLGGEVRPGSGTLAVAEGARRADIEGLIVPADRAGEAALVEGIEVAGATSLREVVELLDGTRARSDHRPAAPAQGSPEGELDADLADVHGQLEAIAAIELAAAGGHNLLLEGPPGVGKTMLARRIPGVLPPLSRQEALEVTRIHSVAGLHSGGLVSRRPFRAPHHTISASGLVGGGSVPAPGEASLAHHGVLFLDELSEFSRSSLEALRQPLEDGRVAIVRGQRTRLFPTRFMLVAATNPCPCGHAGEPRCACSEAELARHRRRLSGPLLDRIDLLCSLQRPSAEELRMLPAATSEEVRRRVIAGRARQERRFAGHRIACNGQMSARAARELAGATASAEALLREAYERDCLSARAVYRVLRVARTAADLSGSERVKPEHVMRALSLRQQVARPLAA